MRFVDEFLSALTKQSIFVCEFPAPLTKQSAFVNESPVNLTKQSIFVDEFPATLTKQSSFVDDFFVTLTKQSAFFPLCLAFCRWKDPGKCRENGRQWKAGRVGPGPRKKVLGNFLDMAYAEKGLDFERFTFGSTGEG